MTVIPQPLNIRHFDNGPRRVLALHCTIAFSGAWRGVSEALPECSLTAPDMLSHGRSPDWDRQGDFVTRMLDALEPLLDEPMDIVGHSLGGLLALRLADRQPGRVRSLTMIEPIFFAVAQRDLPRAMEQESKDMEPVIAALEAGDNARAAQIFNSLWGIQGGPAWADLPEQMRAAMVRGIHVVQDGLNSVFDDSGLLDRGLSGLTMPALLIRGGDSSDLVQAVNEGLAARLPDAQSVSVPGAGHMVPITHPQPVAEHLRALFDRAPV